MRTVVHTLAIVLATTATAYAAGGGGEGHHASPLDFSFIATVINFVIFVFLLVRFARKPIAGMLEQRSEELKKVVAEVAAQREALAEEKAQLEAAVKDLEQGRSEKVRAAKEHAEEEARHLIEEARAQADSLIDDAKDRAEGILKSAEEEAIEGFVRNLVSQLRKTMLDADPEQVDQAFLGKVQEAVKSTPQAEA